MPAVREPSAAAIVVHDLVQTYGATRAVDHLSFSVARGEVFALLGPNGAGKTTTIETLEGYRSPGGGSVRVLGQDPIVDGSTLKARIGVMPQSGGMYPAMTPREALRLFARYYPSPRDATDLLSLVGLDDAAGTRYRTLSGGQKQRLSLALALLPQPEVIFLDEPTAGLDPSARAATWDIIRDLRAHGVTVLLSTHYLDEAERLADRVAIIDHGRLIALDTPGALVSGDTSSVRVRAVADVPLEDLASLPHSRAAHRDGPGQYTLSTLDAPQLLVEIAELFRGKGVALTELRVGEASLEEVFLRLTGGPV